MLVTLSATVKVPPTPGGNWTRRVLSLLNNAPLVLLKKGLAGFTAILVKSLQSTKAVTPMPRTPLPSVTFARREQRRKTAGPIFVTLSGMKIVFRLVQDAKA